jgi:hypothetical protein
MAQLLTQQMIIDKSEADDEDPKKQKLYESIAKPHLYHFAAKHYRSKRHSMAARHCPSGTQGVFEREFGLFCHFFRCKTKYAWHERLVHAGKGEDDQGGGDEHFRYLPPVGFSFISGFANFFSWIDADCA